MKRTPTCLSALCKSCRAAELKYDFKILFLIGLKAHQVMVSQSSAAQRRQTRTRAKSRAEKDFRRSSARPRCLQGARQRGAPGAQVVFLWDMSAVIGKGLRERATGESASPGPAQPGPTRSDLSCRHRCPPPGGPASQENTWSGPHPRHHVHVAADCRSDPVLHRRF